MKANTIAKELLFCTVRITKWRTDGKVEVGTGFLFDAGVAGLGKSVPLLVTNKHVVENAQKLQFDYLVQNADNTGPELGLRYQEIIQGSPTVPFVGHPVPDVDVAVLPMADVFEKLMSKNPQPFIKVLNWELLPTDQAITEFDAIEELTFVGYPSGMADPVNHTPIVRKAITATPLGIPFGNDPTFLLDGAVFGGSSGSPVFIFNRDTWKGTDGNLNLGSRLILIGIVARTYSSTSEVPVKTSTTTKPPYVEVAQSLNLGVAFSSKAIVETINHALAQHHLPIGKGLKEHG